MRGNLQAYFLILDLVAIPSLGLPRLTRDAAIVAAASAVVGFVAGALLASSVSERAVRWAVLIASAAGGVTATGFGVFAVLHPG